MFNLKNQKIMKKIALSLTLALVAFTFSCKKKNTVLSPQELILGKWRIVAHTRTQLNLQGNPVGQPYDMYANTYEDCEKDDFTEFLSGGVFAYDKGNIKCDPNEYQRVEGMYEMSADGKTYKTRLSQNAVWINHEIIELNSNVLRSKAILSGSGSLLLDEYTYNRIR